MLRNNSDSGQKMAPSLLPEVLSLDVTGVEPSYVKKPARSHQTAKSIYRKDIEVSYMDAYKRSIPVSMSQHPGVHITTSLQHHHDMAPSSRLSEVTSLDYIFQVKAMKTGPVAPPSSTGSSSYRTSCGATDMPRKRACGESLAAAAASASGRAKAHHRVTFKDNLSEQNRIQTAPDGDAAIGSEDIVQEGPTSTIVEEEPDKKTTADLCSSVVVYGSSVVRDAGRPEADAVVGERRQMSLSVAARRSAKDSVHLFKRRWKTFCQVQKFSRPTSNELLSCLSIQSADRRRSGASTSDVMLSGSSVMKPHRTTIMLSAQSARSGITGVSSSCSVRSWPFSKTDANSVLFYRNPKEVCSPMMHGHVLFNNYSHGSQNSSNITNNQASSKTSTPCSDIRKLRLQPTKEAEVGAAATPCALSPMGRRSGGRLVVNRMSPGQVLQVHKVDAYLKTKPSYKMTTKPPTTPGRAQKTFKLMTCNGDRL